MPVAFPYEYNPLHLLQLGNAVLPILDRLPLLLSQTEIQNVKDMMTVRAKETGNEPRHGTNNKPFSAPQQLSVWGLVGSLGPLRALQLTAYLQEHL